MSGPRDGKGRPPTGAAIPDTAGRPSTILPSAPGPVTGEIPAPHELSARGWEISRAYYESGVVVGITIGRQQAEDEWRGTYEISAAIARQVAKLGPFDELADRRAAAGTGRPDRGERQRAILAERGIA